MPNPRPANQWLDKEFLNVEKPGVIAVEFPEATDSWRLTRRFGNQRLATGRCRNPRKNWTPTKYPA